MMQDINMKIGDYFERLKYPSVWDKNRCLDKGAGFSPVKKFDGILSSCRFVLKKAKSLESGGLKISDYLASPVQVRRPGRNRNRSDFQKIETNYKNAFLNNRGLSKHMDFSKKGAVEEDTLNESDCISYQKEIDQSINEASTKYGLPACLIKGVIKAESDFQVTAVSSAGAQGLMQLMPETAKELGVKDPFDIDQNIDGGTRYLKKMLDLFGRDVKLALAAYNAGPGTVNRYEGNVPYRETMHYVERVLKYSRQLV
jgi:soluble lytic murein transglycosylase-like protein